MKTPRKRLLSTEKGEGRENPGKKKLGGEKEKALLITKD